MVVVEIRDISFEPRVAESNNKIELILKGRRVVPTYLLIHLT